MNVAAPQEPLLKWAYNCYVAVFFLYLAAPLAAASLFAFNDSLFPALPWRGFTLDWFFGDTVPKIGMFHDRRLMGSLWNSVLIGAIVAYRIATVMFGISTSFWLTFACLAVTGAADTVSMVFRNLIRQLETPDHLRGRMLGVNMVFFMGGPQLGELEAGLVANWLGPVVSVVTGGLGCLLATAWIAGRTPALRHYRTSEAPTLVPRLGRPPAPAESPLQDVQPPAAPLP